MTMYDKIIKVLETIEAQREPRDERAKIEAYDEAVTQMTKLVKEEDEPLTLDEAIEVFNRLLKELWFVEKPVYTVVDEDRRYESLECEDWKHGYTEGHLRQRAETFSREVLYDIMEVIQEWENVRYEEGRAFVEDASSLQ